MDLLPTQKRPRLAKLSTDSTTRKDAPIVCALRTVDPVLQFLTRATGKPNVPLRTIIAALPGYTARSLLQWRELAHRGVLEITSSGTTDLEVISLNSSNENICISFPQPPTIANNSSIENKKLKDQSDTGTLHGSTKAAAKRRLSALKRSLKLTPTLAFPSSSQSDSDKPDSSETDANKFGSRGDKTNGIDSKSSSTNKKRDNVDHNEKNWDVSLALDNGGTTLLYPEILDNEHVARQALQSFLKYEKEDKNMPELLFAKQAAFAASHAGRQEVCGRLSQETQRMIPKALMNAFGLDTTNGNALGARRLYSHQVTAIESAMQQTHTLVCTGTGSGKSLCFLVPILAAAIADQKACNDTVSSNPAVCNEKHLRKTSTGLGGTSIVLFPTKALAQDQMTKLQNDILQNHPELKQYVRIGIIDGDTPFPVREEVAKHCNVILTNPDTLHAAILPGWKGLYRKMLGKLKFCVIDEAHMYEGVFGAHVAVLLSRLLRVCAIAARTAGEAPLARVVSPTLPTFLACSATMTHPEHHFRMLCPISKGADITVIEEDGSPRRPKHFFVWNPPILDMNGLSTGQVTRTGTPRKVKQQTLSSNQDDCENIVDSSKPRTSNGNEFYRRFAADECALLLACAISNNIRCIAFCKTRSLVEWVYERTVAKLRSKPETRHLSSRVESYRGGYSHEVRRGIEQRLFQNQLLGVVGTSALELGVDVGGIDITLHCGYPSSINSLLQQAGRAGRGAARLHVASLSIMVCFNSPSEQHLWRYPKSLLHRGRSIPPSLPVNEGLVQGHMLCAGKEFPLTGDFPATALLGWNEEEHEPNSQIMSDRALFGSTEMYNDALESLLRSGSLVKELVPVPAENETNIEVFKTHPSIKKPSLRVSLRSIEAISYSIVDVDHPLQGGLMDAVHDKKAVLDTIPYSRVFYHAFPGAIIMHRGKKYKVHAMAKPPPFANTYNGYRSSNLAAFAKITTARYSTRPLSTLMITICKQVERVDIGRPPKNLSSIKNCQTGLAYANTIFKLDQPGSDVNRIEGSHSNSDNKQQDHNSDLSFGSVAGNGVVTVKRSVHGYQKLSPVTRAELSRTEISLPAMEFDTYALWIDTEATALNCTIPDYDAGVHALSHALIAVAPLFVPCSSSDLDCDHTYIDCTRVMIFDVRVGGSGTTAELWKHLFIPDGLLAAAIDLLDNCPSCQTHHDSSYQGGCPACLQSGQCIKFNQNLCRASALVIAKRMLKRLEQSSIYTGNIENRSDPKSPLYDGDKSLLQNVDTTPRRKARERGIRNAKDLRSAQERQIIVGRPTWPFDQDGGGGKQAQAD